MAVQGRPGPISRPGRSLVGRLRQAAAISQPPPAPPRAWGSPDNRYRLATYRAGRGQPNGPPWMPGGDFDKGHGTRRGAGVCPARSSQGEVTFWPGSRQRPGRRARVEIWRPQTAAVDSLQALPSLVVRVLPIRAASRWRASWGVWRGSFGDGVGAALGRGSL